MCLTQTRTYIISELTKPMFEIRENLGESVVGVNPEISASRSGAVVTVLTHEYAHTLLPIACRSDVPTC